MAMSTTEVPHNSTLTTVHLRYLPSKMRITVGVITCIFGNLLISVALNIQKHAHNVIADTGKPYIKSFIWWIGMTLMAIGECFNFAAYGFAPTGLIATLGSTGVVFNTIIAVMFIKEKLRIRNVVGTLLAIGGGVLLVYYTNQRQRMLTASDIEKYLQEVPFIVFVSLEAVVFAFLLYLRHCKDISHVVVILIQGSLLSSVTVASAKGVSSMVTVSIEYKNQLFHPVFYFMLIVMLITIVGQIYYLQEAMSLYKATVVIPINYIFFSMAAILSGISLYHEMFWKKSRALGICMVVFGVLLSFGGVYLINQRDRADDEDEGSKLLDTGNATDSSTDQQELQYDPPFKANVDTE